MVIRPAIGLAIHPCSFIEYLTAIGVGHFVDMITNAVLPNAFHDEIFQHFNLINLPFYMISALPHLLSKM